MRAAISILNLESSCAIRADLRSGLQLSALSSIVLTFQHVTLSIFSSLQVDEYLFIFVIFRPQ